MGFVEEDENLFTFVDSIVKSLLYFKAFNETNLYLYTGNNPINYFDDSGFKKSKNKAHKKGKRPSTKDKHEKGIRRNKVDKPGGEKGDLRRVPFGKKRRGPNAFIPPFLRSICPVLFFYPNNPWWPYLRDPTRLPIA